MRMTRSTIKDRSSLGKGNRLNDNRNRDKNNSKRERLRSGPRKSQWPPKEHSPKRVMTLLQPMRTKVGLGREEITQNLGETESRITQNKVKVSKRKLSSNRSILMEMVLMQI